MTIDLSNEETAALVRLLNNIIDGDRYPLSPRILTLSRQSRNQTGVTTHYPSAVRAILDDPPIRIRPIFPHRAGAKETNPVGSSHFGIPMMASTMPRSHQILLTTCRECVCKRLICPR